MASQRLVNSIMLLAQLLAINILWHGLAQAQTTEPQLPTTTQSPCPAGCYCDFETRRVSCQASTFSTVPTSFPSYTTTLILSHNNFATLPENSFLGLPNLALLDLTACQIQTIVPGAFNGLQNLRILRLPQNYQATLSPGMFAGLTSLIELNLERNQVQILPGGVFPDVQMLQVLNVNNNPLFQISDNAFSGLASLAALNLKYGQLTEVPHRALEELANLKILALSGNPIPSLPAQVFSSLSSLNLLYLDNLELKSIEEESFAGLQAVTTIDLAYNKIRSLDPVVFQSLTALDTLFLTGNLWDCSCPMLSFVEWLKQGSVQYYSTSWYCTTPSHLNNFVVYALEPHDFACSPVFTTTPVNTAVRFNTRAVFECRAIGDPEPTIQWYKPDGTRVTGTSNLENIYTALSGSVLVIQSAKEDSGGIYNCTAMNERGSASVLVQVLVTDIPSPEVTTSSPRSSNSTAVDRTLGPTVEPTRVSCTSFTLQTRVEYVTDTSITASWTPYNGNEIIDGYIVQSHVFGDVQTNSYYVNWTQASYELTNLFPTTGYTVCAAFLLQNCPLVIPREQCREVTTQGEDPVILALQAKHRNEIIGTALAACFGTLFLMASVFLILWRYRKPKKYNQYDFKGDRNTAAFADIPDDVDGRGIIVREGINSKSEATSYTNLGMELSPDDCENVYVKDPLAETMSDEGNAIRHHADVHTDILEPPPEYNSESSHIPEGSDVTDTTVSVQSSNSLVSDDDGLKEPRQRKDKRSKVKKGKSPLSSDDSMETSDVALEMKDKGGSEPTYENMNHQTEVEVV